MDQLSPAVASLLERAVLQPAHFTPLRKGHLESVAALFQVHPFVVSELREHLARPTVRKAVAQRLFRTWRAQKQAQPPAPASPRTPATVTSLLERVKATPGGMELFLNSPTETLATLFNAHPFVVDAARAVATQHETQAPRPSSPYWLPPARA
ncbi:MAG: hypothetical protein AB1938_01685 [Myxococcota bacterium]